MRNRTAVSIRAAKWRLLGLAWVLIPDKPALCQAAPGSRGARLRGGGGLQRVKLPSTTLSHFSKARPFSFQVTADMKNNSTPLERLCCGLDGPPPPNNYSRHWHEPGLVR